MGTVRGLLSRSIALVAITAFVAAACTGGSASSDKATATPQALHRGGVLREGVTDMSLSDNMDPTGEYQVQGWLDLGPMVRTLVTYRLAAGQAGNQIVPDLATSIPKPSDGGLVWTFHLKQGIRFGPPVNREITSRDLAYAFERINLASLAAQYGFYYDYVIKGMTGTAKTMKPISGITTPNASTIVFQLTQPVGDFLARLTLPATGPIPAEVARCFTTAGFYGRYVISSGPYMIQGSANLNDTSCSTMKPISGFNPETGLTLVRNPNYDPATDRQADVENYPNAIQVIVDTNLADIYSKIETGAFDFGGNPGGGGPPKTVLQKYLTTPSLRDRFISIQAGGFNEYFQMNLTVPPFDDVHVRKAVNYVIDKAAIQQAWGGSVVAQIATHFVPNYLLGNVPQAHFNLYPTPGNAGDLAKAQAEMRQSRYDPLHDGKCDIAKVCQNVVMINNNTPPFTDMEPIIVQDLAEIGIGIVPRELSSGAAFNAIQNPKSRIPTQIAVGWAEDYPDAFPYYNALWDSKAIFPSANDNFSMVGLTPAKARSLGIPYPPGGVPSIDGRINSCEAIQVGTNARNVCWANLERYLMADVVPVVPLLWYNDMTIISSDVLRLGITSGGFSLVNTSVANNLSVPAN